MEIKKRCPNCGLINNIHIWEDEEYIEVVCECGHVWYVKEEK